MTYGATPEQWQRFVELGLTEDLLPVVSDPTVPIDPNSTLKATGKTPSVVKANGHAVGLYKWTQHRATSADIARWSADERLGIAIQCRTIRAIDIDVPDLGYADEIYNAVVEALQGEILPLRYREGTGKQLLAFRYEGEFPKRVVPVDGGIVEMLGDGQQFIANGWHAGGQQHYQWTDFDGDVPTLDAETVERIWDALCGFATGTPTIARQKRAGVELEGVYKDELATWLAANWEIYGEGSDGQLFLRCPFERDHSTHSGDTSTAYFIAGTGGYERGHWVCLHAHCAGRTDAEFNSVSGYSASSFKPLAVAPLSDPLVAEMRFGKSPGFKRNNAGFIDAISNSLCLAIAHPPITGYKIVLDDFKAEIVWIPVNDDGSLADGENWRAFGDVDYTKVRNALERFGFRGIGKDLLREAVHHEAVENRIDTAVIWLSKLRWDGIPRVGQFLASYFGVAPSAYATAVSRYIWSGLAGRVLEPGVQADMVPIMIGEQGARKTSAIKAMVPHRTNYVTINLMQRDTDLSRIMRGKLIGELEELRGFNSREAEEIKAWVSKTEEEWIPKFKEYGTTFPRRLLITGTGNEKRVLADSTGERRYLPYEVATHGPISPERIAADRDQLWAEGAMLFRADGVQWEDAETLAKPQHARFKISDGWTSIVRRWLDEDTGLSKDKREGPFSVDDVLMSAIHLSPQNVNGYTSARMRKVLKTIGMRPLDDAADVWDY